jgi:hypothetical protein
VSASNVLAAAVGGGGGGTAAAAAAVASPSWRMGAGALGRRLSGMFNRSAVAASLESQASAAGAGVDDAELSDHDESAAIEAEAMLAKQQRTGSSSGGKSKSSATDAKRASPVPMRIESPLDTRNPALALREPGIAIVWLDRAQAETSLRNRAPGAWMLRASRVPGCLTLTVLSNRSRASKIVHILIGQLRDGSGFGEVDKNMAVMLPVYPSLRSLVHDIGARVGATVDWEQLGGQPPLSLAWANAERDATFFTTAAPLVTMPSGNVYAVDDATASVSSSSAAGGSAACAPDRCELFTDIEMPIDIYERDFVGRPHALFVGESESVHEVYAVLTVREGDRYRALRIHKRGSETLFVLCRSLTPSKKASTLPQQLLAYLCATSEARAKAGEPTKSSGGAGGASDEGKVTPGLQFRLAEAHAAFVKRVRSIETQHPQSRLQTKLAFIFSTGDDACGRRCDKSFAAANSATRALFESCLFGLGEEINLATWRGYRGDMGRDVDQRAVFAKWRQLEVMFHVSTMLDAEMHRRLIGNDVGVVLWRPPNAPPLDFSTVDLGTVQQVFAIVQPVLTPGVPEPLYRVAFIRRTTVAAVGPRLPLQRLLTMAELRPLLLSYMANGVCKALVTAPPMNLLFYKPRGATIAEIVATVPAAAASSTTPTGADIADAGAPPLDASEQEEGTLVVCVAQATRLAEEAPAKASMYCVVRLAGEEKRSTGRAGPLPIFAHRVPLQLKGLRRATTVLNIELWLEKSRKDQCVGQWQATLQTVLQECTKRRDYYIVLDRRPDDSNEPGDVGELQLQFELMGANMHHDGEDDLTQFAWYFSSMSSSEAYALLKPMATGAFLVRPSTKSEGSFVISYKSPEDSVIHALVTKNDENLWSTTGATRSFASIEQMIRKYQQAGIYVLSPPNPKQGQK